MFLNCASETFDFAIDASTEASRNAGVRAVCRGIVVGWSLAKDADIVVDVIGGGITNELFRATWDHPSRPSSAVRQALVRLYGQNTELLINRDLDNEMFAELSRRDYSPTFHGRFTNGRIEGWINASPLEPLDMGLTGEKNYQVLIARQLARLHRMRDMPGQQSPRIFALLADWKVTAAEVAFPDDPAKQARIDALDVPAAAAMATWLESELKRPPAGQTTSSRAFKYGQEVVFCHNDLLSGNVLSIEENGVPVDVQVIDYEYSSYNCRAFDIANHWCEYAGFEFDLRDYPSQASQLNFLHHYLLAASPELFAELKEAGELQQFLVDLSDCANRYALLSHVYWGLWAVIQAKISPIDFDFIMYGQQRFAALEVQKAQFFPSAASARPSAPAGAGGSWMLAAAGAVAAVGVVAAVMWRRQQQRTS